MRERKELEQKAEDAAAAAASSTAVSHTHGSDGAGSLQPGSGAKPSDLSARILVLQQELAREQAERRKIHNTLVDLRGNVSETWPSDFIYINDDLHLYIT